MTDWEPSDSLRKARFYIHSNQLPEVMTTHRLVLPKSYRIVTVWEDSDRSMERVWFKVVSPRLQLQPPDCYAPVLSVRIDPQAKTYVVEVDPMLEEPKQDRGMEAGMENGEELPCRAIHEKWAGYDPSPFPGIVCQECGEEIATAPSLDKVTAAEMEIRLEQDRDPDWRGMCEGLRQALEKQNEKVWKLEDAVRDKDVTIGNLEAGLGSEKGRCFEWMSRVRNLEQELRTERAVSENAQREAYRAWQRREGPTVQVEEGEEFVKANGERWKIVNGKLVCVYVPDTRAHGLPQATPDPEGPCPARSRSMGRPGPHEWEWVSFVPPETEWTSPTDPRMVQYQRCSHCKGRKP